MSGNIKRLWSCARGSVVPIVGLALIALVGATGAAIDMGRVQMVQSKLSTALDAAGLAAGATVDTSNLNAEVTKYFNANYPAGYLGSTITGVSAVANADNTVISLSASANVPTTFMQILGINNVPVNATSQITRSSSGLELALVLDNTGSMNQMVDNGETVNKITALKSAAADLVNILYGGSTSVPNLWIGLVPFTQAVNIGTGYSSWMDATYDAGLNWGPQSWMGCVMARPSPYDISDDPPSVQLFDAYDFPTTGTVRTPVSGSGVNGNCSGGFNPWKCTVTPWRSTTNTLTYDFNYSSSLGANMGPNVECPQQVTPMTADKNTILNGINSMVAAGDTDINIGLAWGWRLLSPRWRGLWGGEMNANGLPLDYNSPQMNKAVVLMTDGMNHYTPGNYTAYGFLSDGQLGTTNETTAESTLDTRTLQVCTDMKNNGIIVYTIGFGSGTGINTSLLQSCASKPSFFFLAPTNADLSTAFHMIGDSLASLRVSQ